ncbi:MAG: NRDE family protein [Ectothiorhodospiraceae bacterium]|jgi:uncharacterized protein with NRDE domain
MCLLLLAYRTHPGYPLIVAANRDEFHERETAPAAWWEDRPILAGRDLEAGGTWLGVSRTGRFAALTNYRDPSVTEPGACSRGELPLLALEDGSVDRHIAAVDRGGDRYNGFNLLLGDPGRLACVSNRGPLHQDLPPGMHALSNDVLNTPWPKAQRGLDRLATYLRAHSAPDAGDLADLMHDRVRPADADLPDTGVGLEWERLLAPMFIVSRRYGTRSTSIVLFRDDGAVQFLERRYDREGRPSGETADRFVAAM